jgi:hypothetical protein
MNALEDVHNALIEIKNSEDLIVIKRFQKTKEGRKNKTLN